MHLGKPWPLGASLTGRGVNFSVVAPLATRLELLLFAHGEATEPSQVIELDQRHRSADHWHVEVEGIGIGQCYGYRVFGPLQPGGHGFNPSKVLLDPCARAIAGWETYRRGAAVGAAPNTAHCLKGVVTERCQEWRGRGAASKLKRSRSVTTPLRQWAVLGAAPTAAPRR